MIFVHLKPSPYFTLSPTDNPLYPYTFTLRQYEGIVREILRAEVLLILIAGGLTIACKLLLDYIEKKHKIEEKKCKKYFYKQAAKKKLPDIQELPKKWKNTAFLLEILESINWMLKSSYWEKTKKHLATQLLLPKARCLSQKKSWKKRFFAARVFALHCALEDEARVIQLLNDPVPIVQYTAALAIGNLSTENGFNAAIDLMSQKNRFFRIPIQKAADGKIAACHIPLIEKKLESSQIHPYDKVSCLEILSLIPSYKAKFSVLESCLNSSHKNLQIAAIRMLGKFPSKEGNSALIKLLDSSEWEVRALAARQLSTRAAIPKLASSLKDKNWWVRRNAAQALARMHREGRRVLSMQDPDIDKYAYEIANFFLLNNLTQCVPYRDRLED